MRRLRLVFDNYTLILIAVVIAATLVPARGVGAVIFEWATTLAIGLLFFFHGAKLSRRAIIDGLTHWRLHLLVLACTFIMFPLIAWGLKPVLVPLLGVPLFVGMLYLCTLPGTVQSAIAFTAVARGNVAAAICSASAISLLGIVLTPLLLQLLLESGTATGSMSIMDAILKISAQLLLPFLIGHLMRPWIGAWIDKNQFWLKNVDQSSILLVVYTAFSASVVGGLWDAVPPPTLVTLTLICCVLLAFVLVATTWLARTLGFNKEDEITIVFCGSKKSMATGVPMAQVLFTATAIGPALLPLIIYHQIQLMVCAVMAQNYARRFETQKSATHAA